MAPSPPRLRILSVGGNAVSAFLSWRLQATNACDVTLVWKSGFEQVSQYGIQMRSKLFGNERFKPRHVVRSPEDAAGRKAAFDYVLLCVKALPDVYDLAAVIESVVTPQHTCILVNTTHSLGVESHLESRFPTNVVLSLVSGAEIAQLAPSEFEHIGATDVWVGPANKNASIPAAIQNDMAEALAMTLSTGQVDCKVSENIRQQQYERMIGPIAFYPTSVLFETPSHAKLLEKAGVERMISGIIDELLQVAHAQGCDFGLSFKSIVMKKMSENNDTQSIMYQDFVAKRPMEVETYLGSPIKLAEDSGLKVPRIETLYALLHNCNTVNQQTPAPSASPNPPLGPGVPPPRLSSTAPPRGPMNGMNGPPNGMGRGRAPSYQGPPMQRRGPGPGPPMMNGYPPRQSSGGYGGGPPRGPPPNQLSRRPSFEGDDLQDFSHLVLYDDIPEGGVAPGYGDGMSTNSDLALRERELALRQRELQLREREYNMRRGPRRAPPSHVGGFDDDDDDDDFFDPNDIRGGGPMMPPVDTDNLDMMSVTSRRNRKAPNLSQIRSNPEGNMRQRGGMMRQSHSYGGRPGMNRNRGSQQLMSSMPSLHDSVMDDPMMGYSSNRYGTVDRKTMGQESRTNSLTAARLSELQGAGNNAGMNGAYPSPAGGGSGGGMPGRRSSQSPGNPFTNRNMGRPSPPEQDRYNNMGPSPGGMPNGGPSPPGMMRQPVPRYPPGQGNAVAPQQVEQHAGVSNQYLSKGGGGPPPPPPKQTVRSLTGSASASAGSGDSQHLDSDPSAHSSQSSLAAHQAAAARAAQGRPLPPAPAGAAQQRAY